MHWGFELLNFTLGKLRPSKRRDISHKPGQDINILAFKAYPSFYISSCRLFTITSLEQNQLTIKVWVILRSPKHQCIDISNYKPANIP